MLAAPVRPGERHTFVLPPSLEASEPPEARGLDRDQVRLLVAWRHTTDLAHTTFRHLHDYLRPGDLLVVNNSATLPASVPATVAGGTVANRTAPPLELHLSTHQGGDRWVVEPRRAARPASLPFPAAEAGLVLELPGGGEARLLAPYGTPGRLWVASLNLQGRFDEWLAAHGSPIRYSYVCRPWPIEYYQTVFAQHAGSAEMPSAARPFSAALVTDLVSRGIGVAPITLHCGVSSLEGHEAPMAEWFDVPESTADLVNQTRRRGGRVIAVGTTVVRALESSATAGTAGLAPAAAPVISAQARAARGWTDLVVTPEHRVQLVDGMITGWHEPAASHLAMLEAVGGAELLDRSYRAALAEGYLWHEFGDSHLILP
ncbi:MAG: S-adenosylmethionine:tRNA ribosyltransferase-isomerase [Acidimicrobiales bacterium]